MTTEGEARSNERYLQSSFVPPSEVFFALSLGRMRPAISHHRSVGVTTRKIVCCCCRRRRCLLHYFSPTRARGRS